MIKLGVERTAEQYIGGIGKWLLKFCSETGKIVLLIFSTIKIICAKKPRINLIFQQMENVGVQSLPIALLTATFTGMVLVLQTGIQLERFGAKLYASGIAARALTREIGPVLTSIVLAGRVGAGITAEIGTMKVTEQLDAMRCMAVDLVDYLVAPRFIAALIMLPLLTILSDLVGIAGGFIVGVSSLGITPQLYFNSTLLWLEHGDLWSGIFKSIFFGGVIAIIGCHNGFEAGYGAQGVGQATTKSVVMSSITILVLDYFLTSWIIKIFSL